LFLSKDVAHTRAKRKDLLSLRRPLGRTSGPHDGRSALDRFTTLAMTSDAWGNVMAGLACARA